MTLSSLVPFHVGNFVHRKSWGTRSLSATTHSTLMADHGGKVPYWTTNDFDMMKIVGRGNFGIVYQAIHREDQTQVALKQFSTSDVLQDAAHGNRTLELLQREVSIHSSIQHQYIVPFLGFFEDHDKFFMVMQYTPHGNLLEYIHRHVSAQNRIDIVRKVIAQVASALLYMEALQVSHRDIKPENILVLYPIHVQLADFGWATWWKQGQWQSTLCGTPEYVAPEQLHRPRRYEARYIDLWELGILTFELAYGVTPFFVSNESARCVFDKIRSFAGLASNASPVDEFCRVLLRPNPVDRCTAQQILDHPFLLASDTSTLSVASPTVAQQCHILQQRTVARS